MNLSQALIERIAAKLCGGNSVPLPGGHGVLFSQLRERHKDLASRPGSAARCYVCLVLLGDGTIDERWNRKEWLPFAAAWFDIHFAELAGSLDAPRWRYLLAAMKKVVEDWIAECTSRKFLIPDLISCYGLARERLVELTRRSGKQGFLTRPFVDSTLVGPTELAWQNVASEMAGQNADRLELLYFLHVFHASLGVPQHSLDHRYEQRRRFYSQVKAILQSGCKPSCRFAGARSRISAALGQTGVMTAPGTASVKLDPIAARLPSCFQTANWKAQPPWRANIEVRLKGSPKARARLLDAHDLGEALADLAMDFVRAGHPEQVVFRKSDYGFLLSLFRDGFRRHMAQVSKAALPNIAIETADGRGPTTPKAIKSYLERMTTDKLIDPAQERLTYLADEIDWPARTTPRYCALCHAPCASRGS